MVNETEQERVRHLLAEALPMLCKSGLNFSSEFSVEALIGITLDKKDVFLVSVKETFKSENEDGDSSAPEKSIDISVKHMSQSDQSPGGTPRRRRKKRRHPSSQPASDTDSDSGADNGNLNVFSGYCGMQNKFPLYKKY